MKSKEQSAGGGGASAHTYISEGLRHLAVPISQLVHDAANARRHSPRNLDAIKASLNRWGQRFPIVVQKQGNIVRAGNGRLEAAKALGWSHIAALVVDDSSIDATAFAIADNRTAELAEWDAETLASLLDTLPENIKLDTGFTDEDVADLLAELTPDGADGLSELYTRKIKAPLYEPKGKRPAVSELIDRTKTQALLAEINAAKLPEEVATFLRVAAERHTAFNFAAIAEWYCHAEPDVQRLMENSALVIIDFNRALENGFVKMTERLAALAGEEEADTDA
jgi:ParB-like chromosome segregation protein Spo0J